MYEVTTTTPRMNKRRSWTNRLRDRLKPTRPTEDAQVHDDDWMDPGIAPQLHEGHHAKAHVQLVPSLQGSVFVAANFVYDYRQKYSLEPSNGYLPPVAPYQANERHAGTVCLRHGASPVNQWGTVRGLQATTRTRPVLSAVDVSQAILSRPLLRSHSGRCTEIPYEYDAYENSQSEQKPVVRTQFSAADVNHNIRHGNAITPLEWCGEHGSSENARLKTVTNPVCESVVDKIPETCERSLAINHELETSHTETTVAVDRPGLSVSGQRICILTGQDQHVTRIESEHPEQGLVTKVILKVNGDVKPGKVPSEDPTFRRNCPLRRSLSDRGTRTIASPAHFHDTTRLHHRTRSRGSLHDLFQSVTTVTEQSEDSQPSLIAPKSTITKAPKHSLSCRFANGMRPTEPPPPPPSLLSSKILVSADTPPTAPPRRIFRYSKNDLETLSRTLTTSKSKDPSPGSGSATLQLTPGITSWAGRPLSGQMISWSTWAGLGKGTSGNCRFQEDTSSNDKLISRVVIASSGNSDAVEDIDLDDSLSSSSNSKTLTTEETTEIDTTISGETKQPDVSDLWPCYSSGPVDVPRPQTEDGTTTRFPGHYGSHFSDPDHEYGDHIYEEIDGKEDRENRSHVGLSRVGRSSFAGASRQDILRYLEELRKKNDNVMLGNEPTRNANPALPGLSAAIPSLPHIPADEYEDEDMTTMGALLLAMRHNAPNRNSNRSNASSQSSDESGLSSAQLTGNFQRNKGGGDVERNDSGVGSETSGTARLRMRLRAEYREGCNPATDSKYHPWCVDCDQPFPNPETVANDEEPTNAPLVCYRCARRRAERREVLAEMLETEVRYGRDLRVLQDELYKPLLVAGLVPLRQLDAVFLNVSELSGQSQRFSQRLREAVEIALEQGDEDLLTVDVGKIFLDKDSEEMMDAFRRYCVKSGEASLLLSSLEKERELLRIFLRASQLENPALRRMDLHAFLMVPVQRITKYPLLLGRLLRATAPQDVEARDTLREAQAKVESYLTAINAEAKELGSFSRPWRRGHSVPNLNIHFNLTNMLRPSGEELMTLRLRKLALDALGWGEQSHFLLEGFMKLTQPSDLLLTATRSRGRALKWHSIWASLVILNHQEKSSAQIDSENVDLSCIFFGSKTGPQEAAVIFVKDVKNTRAGPAIYKEPLLLSQCTVSYELELPNFFEVHHIVSKESYICQLLDNNQTQSWLHKLRTLSLGLGRWKQRRNALPHVMMIN